MDHLKPEDLICAGCLKPMPDGGVILSSIKTDHRLHANRASHEDCVKAVQSKFPEDELLRETILVIGGDKSSGTIGQGAPVGMAYMALLATNNLQVTGEIHGSLVQVPPPAP
jgi:hypothetical protein